VNIRLITLVVGIIGYSRRWFRLIFPIGGIPLSNRIHTILAFQGIPPTASNCELHVNIPLKTLFSQRSTSTSGAIQNGYMPQMYLYQLAMPTSQSKGWTWDIFTQLQPTNANNFGLLTGVFLTQTTSQLIYRMPRCPGPSGPMGGVAGFIFGMADDIPFISADVYLEQDYSDAGNIAGFYMKYTW
jgi:hypothetical protein